uniref:Uncharacterized protein n=1 Tax=Lactuca sativa TaxID=4236 RepID=A0A9R1WQR9_LACSA|nr:hypothetical protein LSAT_V11C100042610 [Lactuca sativa]
MDSIYDLSVGTANEFQLGEGVDNTGVTTKFLTYNCSINLLVNIKSSLYGLHIHPELLTLSFNNIPIVTSSVSFLLDPSLKPKRSMLIHKNINLSRLNY